MKDAAVQTTSVPETTGKGTLIYRTENNTHNIIVEVHISSLLRYVLCAGMHSLN